MEDLLILVDEKDNEIGMLDKLTAHQKGVLHRAFSVFIFNSKGELLLQQRAFDKYHSAGLWSNTCCSHPRNGEKTQDAVKRRLNEEMGIKCVAKFQFSFIYKTELENGLTEHEYDYVYFGVCDDLPQPNNKEVYSWKYISMEKLKSEIKLCPDNYSAWLNICLPKVIYYYQKSKL